MKKKTNITGRVKFVLGEKVKFKGIKNILGIAYNDLTPMRKATIVEVNGNDTYTIAHKNGYYDAQKKKIVARVLDSHLEKIDS